MSDWDGVFDDWERCLKCSSYMHRHYVKKKNKKKNKKKGNKENQKDP